MRVQFLRKLWRAAVLGVAAMAAYGQQVLPPSGTVTTIGGFNEGYVDGDNSVSQFNDPWGLTVASNGRLFIADFGNNAVRVLNPANNVVSTFTRQNLNGPVAVIFDSTGRLLVANFRSGNVARFEPSGAFVDFFAAGLVNPTGLAIDFDGNIYVSQLGGVIRQYEADKTFRMSFTVPAASAPAIRGVTVLSDGSVIASDSGNNVLWKFAAAGGAPSVYAGTRGAGGYADGAPGEARFNQPHQIAAAKNNSIVVADRMNHRVRLVDAAGTTSTLYGADPAEWAEDPVLPGWDDGPSGTAWAREPVGVVATTDGTVFSSEVYYDVIRRIAGITYPTNSNGGGTPVLPGAERNKISLGFAGGEASSDFIASPGQYFIAPIVMTVVPNQLMYGLQFNFLITNNTPTTPTAGYNPSFSSLLLRPLPSGVYTPIPPALYTHTIEDVVVTTVPTPTGPVLILTTNYYPQFASLIVPNSFGNFLGIGWLERFSRTNLYNTFEHDLIRFSTPHDTLYLSSGGKVVVGGAGFRVPAAATRTSQYLLAVGRPSANADGVAADVFIEAPDARSAVTPTLSAVRILTIDTPSERRYLVGDVAPFRWYNAGEFGDGSILNNDLAQLHQTFAYFLNEPPELSDMFGAMDSCCIDINGNDLSFTDIRNESNDLINSIAYGDGILNVQDMYVSFRRALDPSLSNYFRIWRGGTLVAEATTNSFRGTPGGIPTPTAAAAPKLAFEENRAMAEQPAGVRFHAENRRVRPGETVRLPIRIDVTGQRPVRSLAVRARVRTLDGARLAAPVAITPNAEFGSVIINSSKTSMDRTVAWMNSLPDLPAGSYTIGTLDLAIPSSATADAVFEIQFDKAQAAIGISGIPARAENAMLLMENRAAAPWDDEIPDAWRVQHFGSLMNVLSAAEADADGDGMNNLEEFRAGTIPTDNASRLALAGRAARGAFVVSWPTSASKFYRLQVSSELTGASWITLEERISGTGSIVERTPAVPNPERAFYRVQVVE